MKFLGIIPARYGSSRFPGKPLAIIKGKTMIQRVYEQASKATQIDKVVVATDDKRIFNHVEGFGGHVVMTSEKHQTGTERCLEAALIICNSYGDFDVVINIQGDEPFIMPEQINTLTACFNSEEVNIATLIKQIDKLEDLNSEHIVKVVIGRNNKALYFSRRPIPYLKTGLNESNFKSHTFYKHIGIYAYRKNTLNEICKLSSSPLEIAESLEQLRWLENNYSIHVNITDCESISIDTPEDLNKIF